MTNIDKVVRLGKTTDGRVFCHIKYSGGKLSITGVVGPTANGDCLGSCGQINMSLSADQGSITALAPGWDRAMLARFFEVWDLWHLNDMKAGSPTQQRVLQAHIFPGYPTSHYEWAKCVLEAAGVQPDPDYLHNGKPYSYGSAWLKVDVPSDVLGFLAGLPDTDMQPAWV